MAECRGRIGPVVALLCLLVGVAACSTTAASPASSTTAAAPVSNALAEVPVSGASVAALHYAANDNLSADGSYPPGRLGFNLADIGNVDQLDALPSGVSGLVFLGLCNGADSKFRSRVDPFVNHQRLFGFYVMDDADPASCAAANLAAETAYIHTHIKGARTFLVQQNLSSSKTPTYRGGYNPANTGIDLFGLDPYPCRSEINGCDDAVIAGYVSAATSAGIPIAAVVPVFQAFGGRVWADDDGGYYVLPTAEQATRLVAEWQRLVPSPVFDYAYSWSVQRGDLALSVAPEALRNVFANHNYS